MLPSSRRSCYPVLRCMSSCVAQLRTEYARMSNMTSRTAFFGLSAAKRGSSCPSCPDLPAQTQNAAVTVLHAVIATWVGRGGGGGGQGGQIIGTRFRMVRLSPCIGREIFICRQLLLLCRAWAPAMQTRAIAFGMLKRCRVCCYHVLLRQQCRGMRHVAFQAFKFTASQIEIVAVIF